MSKPVVVLDPGHGGYDPGASYNGLKEKDLNLVLALKVAERLEGIKVLLTRERDIYVSLADRVALSRRAEPDLFLSLHANAGGGRGFESFIYSGLGAKDPAVAMQRAVHGEIMKALARWEIVDRGLKRAAFYVLRHNPYPAVLIESLFLDNVREANIWREPIFADTLAAGVARGVKAAVGGQGAGNGEIKATLPQILEVGGKKSEPGGNSTPPPRPSPGLVVGTQRSEPGRSRTLPPRPSPLEGGGSGVGTLTGEGSGVGPGEQNGGVVGSGEGRGLYTVQVGAFVFLENARQRLAEAQRAGFSDAYIYQKQG
jgi:N-acetylmuramoyl-L-alanine amidase